MGRDRVRLPVGVDHDGLDPGLDQVVERVVEQRAAAERQQRLGGGVGQRPHARAEAGGEHHGGAGRRSWLRPGLTRSGRVGAVGGRYPAVHGDGERGGGGLGQASSSRRQVRGPWARYCGRWSRRASLTHWQATRRCRCAAQAANAARKFRGIQFGPGGEVAVAARGVEMAAGCRGVHPATARRDRRRDGRARRPGSR